MCKLFSVVLLFFALNAMAGDSTYMYTNEVSLGDGFPWVDRDKADRSVRPVVDSRRLVVTPDLWYRDYCGVTPLGGHYYYDYICRTTSSGLNQACEPDLYGNRYCIAVTIVFKNSDGSIDRVLETCSTCIY